MFEQIFEFFPDAVFVIRSGGKIVLANAQAEVMFGYARAELIGQCIELLVPERFREAHLLHRRDYNSSPRMRPMGSGLELHALRKDGGEVPVEISLSPLHTAEGPLVTAVVRDITERKEAESRVRCIQEELRALAGRLISAKEEENKRLARELHDVFSQRLAALAMEISTLQEQPALPCDSLKEMVERVKKEIGTLTRDVHQLSRQLHPSVLEDLGLTAALKAECAAFSRKHGINAKLLLTNVPDSLPDGISLSLYRIAQEGLWNIAKHAQAREVRLTISALDGELLMALEDDGTGFDRDRMKVGAGLGLVSMEERARLAGGSFSIQSEPGKGTRLEVRVPLRESEP